MSTSPSGKTKVALGQYKDAKVDVEEENRIAELREKLAIAFNRGDTDLPQNQVSLFSKRVLSLPVVPIHISFHFTFDELPALFLPRLFASILHRRRC